MRLRRALWGLGCGLTFLGVVYAFQRPFKEYPGTEYYDFQLPAYFAEKT